MPLHLTVGNRYIDPPSSSKGGLKCPVMCCFKIVFEQYTGGVACFNPDLRPPVVARFVTVRGVAARRSLGVCSGGYAAIL